MSPATPLSPATTARVDELVAAAQAQGRTPSLILGVVRGGGLAHVAAAGDTPTPTPETQYRIGSISKTLTATLVMRSRDAGRLALDDPLDKHLAGTPLGELTVRQLLGHASGLQREPDGPWWERAPGVPLEELVAGLRPQARILPGWRTFHYSNLAYGLLGGLVSALEGASWMELVHDRLLAPLGMTRTTYQCEEPYTRGYVVHPWHGTLREEPRHDSGAMAPAGQLWSTTADLARWAAFLADPPAEVLDPATLEEMTAPVVISDPETWTGGYGLGLQLVRRGERVLVGHGGSMPGYQAFLGVHRGSGTGAVAYTNAYNAKPGLMALCGEVIDEVLDSEPAPAEPWRPGQAPPEELAELCGRWWFMGLEFEITYQADTGELVGTSHERPTVPPWRFRPEGTDRWRCVSGSNHGELMTVLRSPGGAVAGLDIATFEFTRDPWPQL
ncbi:MAG: serine hydrolase domain-containing protein [Micromonosporaceae bacterium]